MEVSMEVNDEIDFQALGKMDITIDILMRMPIKQLKVVLQKLLKDKNPLYDSAIHIIRLIIDHKKKKIDLLQ